MVSSWLGAKGEDMTSSETARQSVFLSDRAVDEAEVFASRLDEGDRLASVGTEGDTHALPPELASVLEQAVKLLARGQTIVVGTRPSSLTTTAAASMLGISRPTLMKMVRDGEIEAHKVGTHTRLRTEDIDRLRRERRAAQRAAFQALRDLEADAERQELSD